MPNPKRRHSNTRTRLRRSHDAIKIYSINKCPQCDSPILSHRVCPSCGFYRGRQVLTVQVEETPKKKP